jgi:two-component system, cell cycle sensor histidine kinase and response regulator CckA
MPGMSGRQLAETRAASHPELRTLYMSAYAGHATGHQGGLEPGLRLIQKPFTLEALGQAVRVVLDA